MSVSTSVSVYMKEKKDDDDQLYQEEYIIIDTTSNTEKYKRTYELYYSNNHCWSENIRGTLIISMTDDGNTITLNKSIKKMEYDLVVELHVLLSYMYKKDKIGAQFKMYELSEV